MTFNPIYKPIGIPMQTAIFMSGSGTNAIKIIERSLDSDANYKVVLIFTDTKDTRKKNKEKVSRALDIAEKYSIHYDCLDILDFYREHGHKNKRDLSLRPEYDKKVVEKIKSHNIDLIALAGYMSIVTKPLISNYEGRIINVHPADLAIEENGIRKYKGIHAVQDAILAGERWLRSTTHVVRRKVDAGEILVRSKRIPVVLPENISLQKILENKKLQKKIMDLNQERLKKEGDWMIYPITIDLIASGRFALDGNGGVYFDGKYVSNGYTLE